MWGAAAHSRPTDIESLEIERERGEGDPKEGEGGRLWEESPRVLVFGIAKESTSD